MCVCVCACVCVRAYVFIDSLFHVPPPPSGLIQQGYGTTRDSSASAGCYSGSFSGDGFLGGAASAAAATAGRRVKGALCA